MRQPLKKKIEMEGMWGLADTCDPSTQEAEARGPGVQSYPLLHKLLKASLGYMRFCFQQKKETSVLKGAV